MTVEMYICPVPRITKLDDKFHSNTCIYKMILKSLKETIRHMSMEIDAIHLSVFAI